MQKNLNISNPMEQPRKRGSVSKVYLKEPVLEIAGGTDPAYIDRQKDASRKL